MNNDVVNEELVKLIASLGPGVLEHIDSGLGAFAAQSGGMHQRLKQVECIGA
jgi:hypothetical protein